MAVDLKVGDRVWYWYQLGRRDQKWRVRGTVVRIADDGLFALIRRDHFHNIVSRPVERIYKK